MKVWMQAALGLCLTAWALSGHAAEKKVPLTPEEALAAAINTFRQAQANARAIESGAHFVQGHVDVDATCKEVDTQARNLAQVDDRDMAKVKQAVIDVDTAQSKCDEARRLKRERDDLQKQLLEASRTMLRLVASDLDRCQGNKEAACHAEKLADVVKQLALTLDPAVKISDLIDAGKGIAEVAANAQASVNKAKVKTADAYALGDDAQAAVFKNKAAAKPDEWGLELRKAAKQANSSAAESRTAVVGAQAASNDLVGHVNDLLPPCEEPDRSCVTQRARAQAGATVANYRLTSQLTRADDLYALTKQASWSAAAGEYGKPEDRRRAVAFARMLDTYPDARSLVGESNAAQINTSRQGTEATIKLRLSSLGLAKAREQSVTLTSPLDSRDRVGTPVSVGYSVYWLSKLGEEDKNRDVNLLWVRGFAPKVDFLTHEYRDPASFGEPITKRAREWTLSAYLGWYWLRNKAPDLHLFTVDVKRHHKHADAEIRCPAPVPDQVATCVQGEFKAPSKDYTRVFKYQLRTQAGPYAWSPTLSYDQRTKEKRLELPIYLWRPEGKDQPFNAGIKLDIGSKSADRVGLFVGTNFDLYGMPDR